MASPAVGTVAARFSGATTIGCSVQSSPRLTGSSLNQDIKGMRLRPRTGKRSILAGSLVAYLALATAISICQIGFFNADFVGYSTIAHRLLKDPRTSITGYWSPLYSWCMAPLIHLGVDDLIAGRVILVAGGVIYLLAVFGVACRFHGADERRNRMITMAVMTVAVLQAATWATRMLDPDLLADGLLFCYFYAVLDPMLRQRPLRALLGGVAAGTAYLGKAYMLPFTLVHLPATLLMRWWISRRSGQAIESGLRGWGTTWVAFLVGQAVIAGPWIVVLTSHYGKLTLSTAGSANHANMSPTAFGNDPLWNPGLVADFIADPHYGPDWSPLQDTEHFLQQLVVICYNLNSCIIFLLPWVVIGGIAAVRQRQAPPPRGKGGFQREFPRGVVVRDDGLPLLRRILHDQPRIAIHRPGHYPAALPGCNAHLSRRARFQRGWFGSDSAAVAATPWWVIPVILIVSLAGRESTRQHSLQPPAIGQA